MISHFPIYLFPLVPCSDYRVTITYQFPYDKSSIKQQFKSVNRIASSEVPWLTWLKTMHVPNFSLVAPGFITTVFQTCVTDCRVQYSSYPFALAVIRLLCLFIPVGLRLDCKETLVSLLSMCTCELRSQHLSRQAIPLPSKYTKITGRCQYLLPGYPRIFVRYFFVVIWKEQ